MPGLGDGTARRDAQARWIAELEAKQEFQLLNKLVEQSESTPVDVVQQMLVRSSSFSNDQTALGDHLYDTACSIIEIVARTPQEQQVGLIAFLIQLREGKVTDPATGESLKYDDQLVWADLPTFGYTFADELNSFNPLDPDNAPEKEQRWENLTAFFAQVTTDSNSKDLDFSLWALTALSYAFGPHEPRVPSTAISVRAVCLWFVYAADSLWAKVQDQISTDWNREEWIRWKQGLTDSKTRGFGGATDEIIEKALARIEEVEKISL